jgi:hypothetical protein
MSMAMMAIQICMWLRGIVVSDMDDPFSAVR